MINNTKKIHVYNKKCDCDKIQKSYYQAPPGCADDDAAVAALPEQWVPRHSGPILANYLKEREQEHDQILKNIIHNAKVLNDNIDAKVRALAELLSAHIQQNKNEIECIINKYDLGDTPLEKEDRDVALKHIYQLHTQRIEEIYDFKREALMLERERADDLRALLRDQFQILVNIGHMPPKDLLHDFDSRVYEINQQLLSNTRAYTDLEAQLRVQADDKVRQARSAINQLCLGVSMRPRGHSALLSTYEEHLPIPRSLSAVNENRNVSLTTLGTLMNDVEGIDACVIRLVQAYKTALIRVFTGFSDKLSDLEKDLVAHHFFDLDTHSCIVLELHQMVDKTVHRMCRGINKTNIDTQELLHVTGTDTLTMQNSLLSFGNCLHDTFNVLHDAGHLWDSHILRQALAQKLTIAAVEDLLTSNDMIEMATEVTFNVALEQLRCSSDVDKLHAQYNVIMGMLEHTAQMYRHHCETELGRLEEFMNLPTSLANTLLSEFNCFLEKYPRSSSRSLANGGSNQSRSSVAQPRVTPYTFQSSLLRAILQTELQEVALRNWRNGFLESFESNVSLVPEELRRQARLWIDERATALHMRYSLKMVTHRVRLERIMAARDARLSELRHHEARLNSHLDALYLLIDVLPIDASQISSLDAPYIFPLNDWIKRVQASIDVLNSAQEPLDPEVKTLKMCSYATRIAKYRRLFEESLNNVFDGYKRQIEHRIQNARISHVRFMSQIKTFGEGGRYAALEATRTCNLMGKGSDALEAAVNRVMDALNRRRQNLMSEADHVLQPVQKACEEVLAKPGAKRDNKGKSAQPAKKK